ncbi:hypothetical protein FACS1894204_04910 [Synergistales bacterium]|nr:hypothetical protein FACS1894204_04910 [Synergistales bacterium]
MKNSRIKRGIFFGLLCAAMVFAPLAALAAGQTITIDKAIAGYVYGNGDLDGSMPNGGEGPLKDINGNTVKIRSGGLVYFSVYGSYFDDTTTLTSASGNSVTIDGGKVNGDAGGGYIEFTSNTDASAEDNRVTLNSGSVDVWIYGGTSRSEGQAHADGNTVTINGGTTGGYIYGGHSYSTSNSADSLNNSVTVTGGTINAIEIHGGYADSDGSGKSGVANGNSVVLSGGDITNNLLVYGGFSLVDTDMETGAATGNSVTVGGGLALSEGGALTVYGGFVGDTDYDDDGDDGDDGDGDPDPEALIGSVLNKNKKSVTGGRFVRNILVPEPDTDAFTGNIFNKDSDIIVAGAANFESVIFGYTGDANITSLDVTPGGSANTVIIDTGSYNINFNGIITGSGNINKKGSGELTLTDITGLEGTITLSDGTIKNGTNGPIDVTVNGASRQLAPGETTNTNSDDDNNNDDDNNGNGNRNSGGCDAGVGVFAAALLPLVCMGMKRKGK